MPFSNYDQWKTASPYDDDIDWAEHGAKCPKCGSDQFEVTGSDGDLMELDLECGDCSNKWVFEIPKNMIQCKDEEYEPLDDSKVYFREFSSTLELNKG